MRAGGRGKQWPLLGRPPVCFDLVSVSVSVSVLFCSVLYSLLMLAAILGDCLIFSPAVSSTVSIFAFCLHLKTRNMSTNYGIG